MFAPVEFLGHLLMRYDQTSFVLSAVSLDGCPMDSVAEVAFAGRSNAGKSSAINAICRQSRLARASKTPGRTQMLNFFLTPGASGRYLVDLPGYGYAKVPLAVKEQWQREMRRYLNGRGQLRGIVLLSDIRHPLKEFDRQMIDWAQGAGLPLHLLLTKADKLKRNPAHNVMAEVRKELSGRGALEVQLFSATAGIGLEQARERLDSWLEA